MAITKIIPIRATIGKSIAYICNPNKTENCAFIYSEDCFPKTASVEFISICDRIKQTNSHAEANTHCCRWTKVISLISKGKRLSVG